MCPSTPPRCGVLSVSPLRFGRGAADAGAFPRPFFYSAPLSHLEARGALEGRLAGARVAGRRRIVEVGSRFWEGPGYLDTPCTPSGHGLCSKGHLRSTKREPSMAWICPCGTSNERGFCRRCGHQFFHAPSQIDHSSPRRMGLLSRILAFIGAVAVILFLAGFLAGFDHVLLQELGLSDRTASTAVDTEQPKSNPPATHKSQEATSPSPYSDSRVRPFTGNLSDYPQYAVTDQVSVGHWSYKLVRPAVLIPTVYGPHREFQPEIGGGFRLGDTQTEVFSIELVVRNDADASSKLPPFTMISDAVNLVIVQADGQEQREHGLREFDQFSGGYIERHLDSSVVFQPGEQLRGVIAFACCLNPNIVRSIMRSVSPSPTYYGPEVGLGWLKDPDLRTFLRVFGGYPSGESALISLSQ